MAELTKVQQMLAKNLPAIKAFAEGKPIQALMPGRNAVSWVDVNDVEDDCLEFGISEFRPKPEPREAWFPEVKCGDVILSWAYYRRKDCEDEWKDNPFFVRAVRFVEDTEAKP